MSLHGVQPFSPLFGGCYLKDEVSISLAIAGHGDGFVFFLEGHVMQTHFALVVHSEGRLFLILLIVSKYAIFQHEVALLPSLQEQPVRKGLVRVRVRVSSYLVLLAELVYVAHLNDGRRYF